MLDKEGVRMYVYYEGEVNARRSTQRTCLRVSPFVPN